MAFDMPDKFVTALLAGLGSAIISAFATYWTVSIRIRKELEAKYDIHLRTERVNVYKKLWNFLQPLAKYSRPAPFTRGSAGEMAEALRVWYFEVGGLFLSERTRDAYFEVQESLKAIAEDESIKHTKELDELTFESLRVKGSTLRTCMARDVGTRRKARYKYE